MIQHNRLHFVSMAVELVVHNLEVLHSVVGCDQSLVTVVQSCLTGPSVEVDQVALHSSLGKTGRTSWSGRLWNCFTMGGERLGEIKWKKYIIELTCNIHDSNVF